VQLPRTAYRPRTEVPSRKSTCARVPPSFPTPVRPLPVASASSGMSLPLRLLALVAVAVWPSATVEAQGTESVVAVPTSSHLCPPYSPGCGNTWTGTAEVGQPCYEACQVNSGDNPPTRWCPTTSDLSGNDGTPWGWCSQNPPSPPPPPPPPAPPPAPRRCIDRGTQNLRLSATASTSEVSASSSPDTTQGRVEADYWTERYVWEGATGNWLAESLTAGGYCNVGRASGGEPPSGECSSDLGRPRWLKALYLAAANRTFIIQGNVTADGAKGPATRCESEAGQSANLMVGAAQLMAYMFADLRSTSGDSGCVGTDGLFPIRVRETRLGRVVHAVYAVSDDVQPPVPGREYAVELVVDEMEDGDGFVPVSFSFTGDFNDDPARCVQGGDSSSCGFISQAGQYTDWDSSEEPVPPAEFEIPAVCFTDAGSAVPHAKTRGRGDGTHLTKLPWVKRPTFH
jgi:hypothetical protein